MEMVGQRRGVLGCAALALVALVGVIAAPAASSDNTLGRALGLAPNHLGPRATQLGDIDGDGRADVFSYRSTDQAWLVSYSGTSAWNTINHGALVPTRTWLADLNGDGRADVFTHRQEDNAWLVSYSGTTAWMIINHAYLNPDVTRFGDVTGDGLDDVFTQLADGTWVRSNGGTSEWVVLNGGSFQPSTTWVGDLNGDGREDVVAVNDDWSWAVSYGGTSAWTIINNGYLEPSAAQLVDVNGDGRSDIYAAFDDGSWRVSYSGTSSWTVVNNGALDPTRTWLADLNGDGTADVLTIQNLTRWVMSSSALGAWQELNNGVLPADVAVEAPGAINSVACDEGVINGETIDVGDDNACYSYTTPEFVPEARYFPQAPTVCIGCSAASGSAGVLGPISGPRLPVPANGPASWAMPGSRFGRPVSGAGAAATLGMVAIGEIARQFSVPWPDEGTETAKKHKDTRYKLYHIYAQADAQLDYDRAWKWGITRQAGSVRPERQIKACNTWFRANEHPKAACRWMWVKEDINGWFPARLLEAQYALRYRANHGECPPGMRACI